MAQAWDDHEVTVTPYVCLEPCPTMPFACTEWLGHLGDHIAHGIDDRVLFRWKQDMNFLSTDKQETPMAKKQQGARNEQTSKDVARVAGSILGGGRVAEALDWLQTLIDSPRSTDTEREHALALISAVTAARRVAASALTQREG